VITEFNRVLKRLWVRVDSYYFAATRARNHDASKANATAAKDGNGLACARISKRLQRMTSVCDDVQL
jgi:hypothetical protein